jgi:hypothetical protein
VQVQVGPVPAASARVWLAYAKSVVGEMMRSLPIQVAAEFSAYLEEWSSAAQGEQFVWEGTADPEQVEYLLHAWFNLAKSVVAQREASGGPLGPPEGRVFYIALVNSLLTALRRESRATAEFADHLAPFWPGLESSA